MMKKPTTSKDVADKLVKSIRRKTLPTAVYASIMCGKPSAYLSAGFAAHSANIVRRSARCHVACLMKNG